MPKRVQRDHWSEAQEVQTGDQLRLLLLSTIHEEGADVGSRPATKRKRIPKSTFRRSVFETDGISNLEWHGLISRRQRCGRAVHTSVGQRAIVDANLTELLEP